MLGPIITGWGVGGAGGNAVEHMIREGVGGVEFICCNTDAQALKKSSAQVKLQLGPGLGAGGKPEKARDLAQADKERIADVLRGAQTQNAFGDTQLNWLAAQMAASTAKWKVLASSVSTRPLVLDLTPPPLGVPAPFNQRFLLNADHWDGFPHGKQSLFARLPAGSVVLSGDIHATLVGTQAVSGGAIVEFTTPAVSSASFRELLATTAANDPLLAPLAEALLPMLEITPGVFDMP